MPAKKANAQQMERFKILKAYLAQSKNEMLMLNFYLGESPTDVMILKDIALRKTGFRLDGLDLHYKKAGDIIEFGQLHRVYRKALSDNPELWSFIDQYDEKRTKKTVRVPYRPNAPKGSKRFFRKSPKTSGIGGQKTSRLSSPRQGRYITFTPTDTIIIGDAMNLSRKPFSYSPNKKYKLTTARRAILREVLTTFINYYSTRDGHKYNMALRVYNKIFKTAKRPYARDNARKKVTTVRKAIAGGGQVYSYTKDTRTRYYIVYVQYTGTHWVYEGMLRNGGFKVTRQHSLAKRFSSRATALKKYNEMWKSGKIIISSKLLLVTSREFELMIRTGRFM